MIYQYFDICIIKNTLTENNINCPIRVSYSLSNNIKLELYVLKYLKRNIQ